MRKLKAAAQNKELAELRPETPREHQQNTHGVIVEHSQKGQENLAEQPESEIIKISLRVLRVLGVLSECCLAGVCATRSVCRVHSLIWHLCVLESGSFLYERVEIVANESFADIASKRCALSSSCYSIRYFCVFS